MADLIERLLQDLPNNATGDYLVPVSLIRETAAALAAAEWERDFYKLAADIWERKVNQWLGVAKVSNEKWTRAQLEVRAKAAEAREKALRDALQLHVAYEALPIDRGGKTGPKGQAWAAFIEARDKALSTLTPEARHG